jgi:hypothetical protein
MKTKYYIIIFIILCGSFSYSQTITTSKDTLNLFDIRETNRMESHWSDTLMIYNKDLLSLRIDSVKHTSKVFGYGFRIQNCRDGSSMSFYVKGLVLFPGDSARLTIYCLVLTKSFNTVNNYSDSLLIFNNSINKPKLMIGIMNNHFLSDVNEKENIPTDYKLYQNYPNPFNPSTKIKYELPKSGYVKIIVYDNLGREVKVLVNQYQNAGYYEIQLSAGELSSGVYYYKIQADNFSETKKFILLK